jgi:DNA-binding MarR family transcriptional regulator
MVDTLQEDTARDFTFKSWPFYWLAQADGRYLRHMEVALKAIALDVPRWRVLMSLHEEGCASVSEIAEHAISKLSTMTRIVQRMEGDGLVTVRPRQSDARVTEVLLTARGVLAAQQAWQAARGVYAYAFRDMSENEIETLNVLLCKLSQSLRSAKPTSVRRSTCSHSAPGSADDMC